MKKLTRFLFLGAIAFFVLVSPAIAVPVTYDFYHPYQGNLWGKLTPYDPVDNGLTYTYDYTLSNVGQAGQSIHRLDLQIGAYTTLTYLESGSGEPLLIFPPVQVGSNVLFMW